VHLSYACISHTRASLIRVLLSYACFSHTRASLIRVLLSYACFSHTPSHRHVSHMRASYACLFHRPSHRRAAPIWHTSGQACGSHRTYISRTCALDRRATLTGHTLTEHVSYGRSDFNTNGQVDTNCPYCPPHAVPRSKNELPNLKCHRTHPLPHLTADGTFHATPKRFRALPIRPKAASMPRNRQSTALQPIFAPREDHWEINYDKSDQSEGSACEELVF
jgi:hypothetical protein